ncbi:hypothetical protein [Megamonas sp.]|uniref:hypothetical protein n=1 Tax=Megamonas sp. TaxID=2049033 RepID=UPI00258368F8|nr:hypothetical protein [Megamonas sp.]
MLSIIPVKVIKDVIHCLVLPLYECGVKGAIKIPSPSFNVYCFCWISTTPQPVSVCK